MSYPVRLKSALKVTDDYQFARHCAECGASFLLLAPGKTGERGIWRPPLIWFCSVDCDKGGRR